jgi:integrase
VNFHSLRRWFITSALRAGQPERVVQQVVGHKAQGVTLGVYFAGDLQGALRACVEAVRLP